MILKLLNHKSTQGSKRVENLNKMNVKKIISKLQKKSNNFVWIEVSKHLIKNALEIFFIVAAYVSDVSSTYYNDEIFEELNKDTLAFCKTTTPIQVIGDFNGRTGLLNDIYQIEKNFLPVPQPEAKFGEVPIRHNSDTTEYSHGNKIINFCKTFDFIILNGRTPGDPLGNFTHLNFNNGPSTIDYALCNENCYELVSNFIILPMNELSDHSKIVTVFKEGLPPKNENVNDNYNWKQREPLYKWDKDKKNIFFTKLKTLEKEIEDIDQRIDAGLVHSTGEQIQQLFIQTARGTLQV